jgi:hypothetical protein
MHYVFDIADTNGQRMPFVWQYKDEFSTQVIADIAASFNLDTDTRSFEKTIEAVSDSFLDDGIADLLDEFKYSVYGSFLEDVDELNLKLWYEETIKESVMATVLFRCGIEMDEADLDFSQLYNFNTPETIVQLGKTTSDMAETILREIELSVKAIEREQRIERSKEHGNQLQTAGQSDDTRSSIERTDNTVAGQVRAYEERIFGEESQREIRYDGADGDTISALPTDRAGSERTDNITDIADEEEHATEPLGSDVNGNRESSYSGVDTYEINEQDDIDGVLLSGSGFEGGKQRIINFFFEDHTSKEKADFLKNEYGVGGGSFIFTRDRHGFHDHNAKGIEIHNNGYNNPSISLTWSRAAKRIGELIENGRYFEQRYPNEKPLTKPKIDKAEQQNIEMIGAENAPFSLPENADRKRRTQPEMNFSRLMELVPHVMDKRYRYAKLKAAKRVPREPLVCCFQNQCRAMIRAISALERATP